MKMLRRRDILLGSLLVALGGAGLIGNGGRNAPFGRIAGQFLKGFGAKGGSLVEGRRHFGFALSTRFVSRLMEQLAADLDSMQPESSRRLRGLISMRVRRDFERGRTVLVDGWVLSITEVRFAALSAR